MENSERSRIVAQSEDMSSWGPCVEKILQSWSLGGTKREPTPLV